MKKTIPILLSAALLLSACGQAAGTAETTSADAPAAVTKTTAQTSAPKTTPGGVDKAETVYAKADADGHRDRDHGGSCAEGPRRRDD